jgi:asparagine synthase (glutamine-hydrolysing)
MNAAMTHRGPDDGGLWSGDHVALAMRRLSILDIAGGRQPMANDEGNVVVVFNGEIYNFDELRKDLSKRGHRFRTSCDTEAIVHAYEEFGDKMLDHFNGMFAIAVYDIKGDRLLLARDRLGIKPLFYHMSSSRLTFASELDSLLQSGAVNKKINPSALDAYFEFLYIPAPDTIFEDVRKLRPGESLVYESGDIRTERYWRPEFRIDSSWTLTSASERYMELLRDSVRMQRVSDVPLGAFLSGGIDSSAVTGVLSEITSASVKTFTIGFKESEADETRYARLAADHFGTDHVEELLRPDMVEMLPALAVSFGEPFGDSSAVPTWLVSKLARSRVTVALSGDGGDEMFAGYSWLHMARKVLAYQKTPEALRRVADYLLRYAPNSPGVEKFRRFSRDSFLDARAGFRRRETCFSPEQRAGLFGREWAGRIAKRGVDRFGAIAEEGPKSIDEWMLYQDAAMYLPDDILTKVDRMSMAHSLEARVPLLDHRIFEFAATLPFPLKYSGGVSKRVVKHAVCDLLPPELLRQRKRGFAIPINRWFREELGDLFRETVFGESARCGEFIDLSFVYSLFASHESGRENYGHHLWAILMFEQWLRYADSVLL